MHLSIRLKGRRALTTGLEFANMVIAWSLPGHYLNLPGG